MFNFWRASPEKEDKFLIPNFQFGDPPQVDDNISL